MKLLDMEPLVVTKLVWAGHVLPGTGQLVHRNRPNHGLAMLHSGRSIYHFSDGTDIRMGAEGVSLIYLPKYSSYWVEILDPTDVYAINFDVAEDWHEPPCTLPASHSMLLDSFRRANQAWNKRKAGFGEECLSCLYAILATLKAEKNSATLQYYHPALRSALEYIRNHYTEEAMTIPRVAEHCQISETYLRQLFQRQMGVSPVQHIRQMRLVRAAELIASGMYSVQQAAELSGFLDESYFSRAFKKAYGVSPRNYAHATP